MYPFASFECNFCKAEFDNQISLTDHLRSLHKDGSADSSTSHHGSELVEQHHLADRADTIEILNDDLLTSDGVTLADVPTAPAGISDSVAALTSLLKLELAESDGEVIPNKEDALRCFRDAVIDDVDSGVSLENVEFPDVASTRLEEFDPESLKRAHFAFLAYAALKLKGKVDMIIDPNAENDHIDCAKKWFNRAQECVLVEQQHQADAGVDNSIDGVTRADPIEILNDLVEQQHQADAGVDNSIDGVTRADPIEILNDDCLPSDGVTLAAAGILADDRETAVVSQQILNDPLVEQAVPVVDGVAEMTPSAVGSEIRASPDDLGLIRLWLFQLYSSQNFEAVDPAVVAELRQLAERLFNDLPDFQIVADKCPVCVDQPASGIVEALTHVLETHHDIFPADDVPFADAGPQRLTFDVAYWEWLKTAIFYLGGAVVTSINPDTDRLVRIDGELVSPEVARQVYLERSGACIVAALACLIKWKEALDQGCPTRELGEEERRQQQQDSGYELLHLLRELRFKEDLLMFIEAAVAEDEKRRRG